MKRWNLLSLLVLAVMVSVLVTVIGSETEAAENENGGIRIWATSYNYGWPSVVATGDESKVLISCTLACNFEHYYAQRTWFAYYIINVIQRISEEALPTVVFIGQYDGGDRAGLNWFLRAFRGGYISTASREISSLTESNLQDVDVLVIDGAFDASRASRMILTQAEKDLIDQQMAVGMKLITTAALYIAWNEWGGGMDIYNYDLINQDYLEDWYGVNIEVGVSDEKRDYRSNFPSELATPIYIPSAEIMTDHSRVSIDWQLGHYYRELKITVRATAEIKPETLKLDSKGTFTAFVTLPDGYNIFDINFDTVTCNGAPLVKWNFTGDKLVLKFNRQDLLNVELGDEVPFTVTGNLYNGLLFQGTDFIRVQ